MLAHQHIAVHIFTLASFHLQFAESPVVKDLFFLELNFFVANRVTQGEGSYITQQMFADWSHSLFTFLMNQLIYYSSSNGCSHSRQHSLD